MNKYLCRPVWIVSLTAVLILLDQWTKYLAVRYLKGSEALSIVDGVFELRYLENRGAAFGILQGQRAFFLVIAALVLAGVVWLFSRMSREEKFWPIRLIAVAVLAGAWGNMLDRMRLGYVVDFFYFRLINFPIFNVADIYVSVAMAALAVLIFFYYKDEDLERMLPGRRRP
ncbi:MAG: signal peptidase II [Eubacteriales bacterium]|nr:signal peptidase II [Eubacteriales bacterium]